MGGGRECSSRNLLFDLNFFDFSADDFDMLAVVISLHQGLRVGGHRTCFHSIHLASSSLQ